MALYPIKRKPIKPIKSFDRPPISPSIDTPEFTTRELNPRDMKIQRDHFAKDGRLATYVTTPGANYNVNMKAVGTPDPNFQISGAGTENIYDKKYHEPMSRKDLEAIGFSPGMWKDSKKIGEFRQDGKIYPIIRRHAEVRQSLPSRSVNSGTGDYKWSSSGRKLTNNGPGRAHPYKKRHGL